MAPSKELSPEQWKMLLERNHIIFERPINPRKWPTGYKETFGIIRDIGRERMDEYSEKHENLDSLPLRIKQERVAKLVIAARDCLTTFKDEDDWREKTEDTIFSRFESEIIWYVVAPTPQFFWPWIPD